MISTNPKDFYRHYLADDELNDLNYRLILEILAYNPASVLEFGCGTGKNLAKLKERQPSLITCGIDISPMAIIKANARHGLDFVVIGSENHLSHLGPFDVAFTCSVFDHLPEPEYQQALQSLKRIATKAIVIAETNDVPASLYYPHNYEADGFTRLDATYQTDPLTGDGATYHIWVRTMSPLGDHRGGSLHPNDDLA